MLRKLSNKQKIWVATVFCFLFMFAEALVGSIYSTLQPFIIEHYGTSLAQSSVFSMSGQIGHLIIMWVVVLLRDRLDKVKLLGILSLWLGIGALGIGTAPSMGMVVGLMFLNTMLTGCIDNTCTAYISNMWGDRRGQMIGAMFVMFVVGQSIAPLINTFILEKLQWGWNGSYTVVGMVCIITCVLFIATFLLMGRPYVEQDAPKTSSEPKKSLSIAKMLQNRNMKALFLANITLSFYMYFSTQLPVYFAFTNAEVFDTATRNLIATCGSIGSVVSRVLYVPLANKMPTIKYLRLQSLTSVAFNVIGLLSGNPFVWMVCMFLSNCISGASFTARTVLTCDEYPEYASSASAATSVASGIAGLIATPLMNVVADYNFTLAMIIPLFFGVGTYFVFRFVYTEKAKQAA